jgi:signal transduction histidine kinase
MTESRRAQEELEARTRDLDAAREQLARKERLAVLGQLAGGVSHELRSPLSVIKNAVFYLKTSLPEDEKVSRYLAILERQVQTANRIVTSLLDFAKTSPGHRVPTDLNRAVRDVLARTPILPTIEVKHDLDPDLGMVLVDREHVELVMRNLLSNAVQAMPEGGTLTVVTKRAEGRVTVAILDTGTGILPEHIGKIFEPLFSTKPKGIGLGLAVVQDLVEMNGGRITVESTPGHGSRFTIHFDAVARGADAR